MQGSEDSARKRRRQVRCRDSWLEGGVEREIQSGGRWREMERDGQEEGRGANGKKWEGEMEGRRVCGEREYLAGIQDDEEVGFQGQYCLSGLPAQTGELSGKSELAEALVCASKSAFPLLQGQRCYRDADVCSGLTPNTCSQKPRLILDMGGGKADFEQDDKGSK
eukprot:761082-Hanusia_phi.AAC.1